METMPEVHLKRVKRHLARSRGPRGEMHEGNITTYNIGDVEPDLEQTTLPLPLPDDWFYISTDECDQDALRLIGDAGGVFLAELLEMEDKRAFGWCSLDSLYFLVYVFYPGSLMRIFVTFITSIRHQRHQHKLQFPH